MSYQICHYRFSTEQLSNVYYNPDTGLTEITFAEPQVAHWKWPSYFSLPSYRTAETKEYLFYLKGHQMVPFDIRPPVVYPICEENEIVRMIVQYQNVKEYFLGRWWYIVPYIGQKVTSNEIETLNEWIWF